MDTGLICPGKCIAQSGTGSGRSLEELSDSHILIHNCRMHSKVEHTHYSYKYM